MTLAASLLTSVPVIPIAIPISAFLKANLKSFNFGGSQPNVLRQLAIPNGIAMSDSKSSNKLVSRILSDSKSNVKIRLRLRVDAQF